MGFMDYLKSRFNMSKARADIKILDSIKDPEPEQEKTQIQENCPMTGENK